MRGTNGRVLARQWPFFLDGVSDGLLLSFACWTLFYQLALLLQFSMLWIGWPWMLLSGLLAACCGMRRALGQADFAATAGVDDTPTLPTMRSPVMLCGGALLVVLVLGRTWFGVWPAAVVVILLLAAQISPSWLTRQQRPWVADAASSDRQPGPAAHLFALAASIGFGVVGLFLLRPDADDVFYVNRATWVATHGTAPLGDTMFGPNTQPLAASAGIPTPSIEAAQGVIAHALGVQAPTFCYLIVVPALGFLAGWTSWRLIRQWARRRWALAMAAAVLVLLTSADSVVGGFSLGRIWQGKATAYLILLPLSWLFLSRTTVVRRRSDLLMLGASGIAFVGLTTSSSLIAPLVTGSALLAALILRSRSLAVGALAFVAAPVLNGLIQVLAPMPVAEDGDSSTLSALSAFEIAFGANSAMVLLALAAVALAPRLVAGRAGVLVGCGAVATMVTILPGVFALADRVTGAGPVVWRLVISLPIWVLIGLMTTLPELSNRRGTQQTPQIPSALPGRLKAVVFVVPLIFGTWLWNAEDAQLTRWPTWKVDQAALADVRAAQERDIPPGRWLLPPNQMQILAISTIEPSAVVPRAFYLGNVDASPQELSDRVALYRLAAGEPVPRETISGAIDRLDVALACVSDQDRYGRRLLSDAVGQRLIRIGHMRCHVRSAS